MSASMPAFPTHLTARQRANDAWDMPELPAEEEARHQRLMTALRRVESAAPVVSDVPADPYRWRKEYNRFLKQRLEGIRCQKQ